jgi:hypothetical protein
MMPLASFSTIGDQEKRTDRMRRELFSHDTPIQQHDDIVGDLADRKPDIVIGEKIVDKDYMDELAFNEEPVTIRIEPSAEKNAAGHFPVWVNGRGCEVLIENQWIPVGYLPVSTVLTVKRKYVEVIMRAKVDTVSTEVIEEKDKNPINKVKRFTSAVNSLSIIKDDNKLSAAWLLELRRRNM